MKYAIAGFVGAIRLFVGLIYLCLIIPPTAIGLFVGIIWNAVLVGYRSEQQLLNWLIGEGHAWKVAIKQDWDTATKDAAAYKGEAK